jgi:hypothetical protein
MTPVTGRSPDEARERWLLLIHQIPPRPAYLRVKIGRHLQRLGAIAIKNSVYALPRGDEALEDLQWLVREIVTGGGEASVLEARFVDGLSDGGVVALFQAAREADYREIAEQARAVGRERPAGGPLPESRRAEIAGRVARLRRRLVEVGAIDFFGAPGREIAEGLVSGLEETVTPNPEEVSLSPVAHPEEFRGRTWVTRSGIKVDRMASAWLIRRFIDPQARFRFVPAKGYQPSQGELRFDMFEAEFSHEGDLCTFEVLCARFSLDAPGLRAVAELVHDIDLKDAKFGRPEVAGLAAQIAGLALLHRDDEARLARGSELFEELLAYFAKKRN